MNHFRTLLLEIGQHLTQNDLQSLKFACSSFIPAGRAETIKQPLDLFLEMERQNKLTENQKELLGQLLIKIGRHDLKNKLLGIQDYTHPQQATQLQGQIPTRLLTQKVTGDMLRDLNLAERISTKWKFLGRYLKLEDHDITNIEDTYRRTEEKSSQMLIKWLQSSDDTSVGTLVTALKKVGRMDLAERVEDYCSNMTTFPEMADLGRYLPPIEHPVTGNPTQPTEHDVRHQPQEKFRERQEVTDGVVPDRPYIEQEEKGPVQVSEGQEDDLKKTGSFLDQNFYRIIEVIGSGGFSKVYCVQEIKSKKYFAVKTVELGLQDKLTIKRVAALKREVEMLRVLDNPYIVKYHKTEDVKDLIGVKMEYMPGGSVAAKIIKEEHIDEFTVRKYTFQLLHGIKFLHDNKVIHRDIKAANILLDKEHKHIKLTDFGISLSMEGIATSTGHCVTNREGIMASVFWTSPELLASDKYSFNTDIWSLGCTVVEMLTGDPPFRKDGLNLLQVMYKISNHQVKIPDDFSSYAKDFLDQCFLEKDKRPTASQLLEKNYTFPVVCHD